MFEEQSRWVAWDAFFYRKWKPVTQLSESSKASSPRQVQSKLWHGLWSNALPFESPTSWLWTLFVIDCVTTQARRTKKVGIVGKYGTRYGASLRKQIKKIEIAQRGRYRCQFCGKSKMRRECVGIWKCRHCGKTIAGGAYTLSYVSRFLCMNLYGLSKMTHTNPLTERTRPHQHDQSFAVYGNIRIYKLNVISTHYPDIGIYVIYGWIWNVLGHCGCDVVWSGDCWDSVSAEGIMTNPSCFRLPHGFRQYLSYLSFDGINWVFISSLHSFICFSRGIARKSLIVWAVNIHFPHLSNFQDTISNSVSFRSWRVRF